MKLITLNLWGGVVYEPLLRLLKERSADTDIFCFQEVIFGKIAGFTEKKARTNLSAELETILADFNSYEYIAKEGSYFGGDDIPLPNGAQMGQAIFIRRNIKVLSEGGFRTYTEESSHAKNPAVTVTGNFQYVEIEYNGNPVIIGNTHGLWQKNSKKLDTPERIIQSEKILDFLNKKNGAKILVGDFNAKPDTTCMTMFEKEMTSLIRKYNVQSTRTSLYKKPEAILFSDYVFTSPEIKVENFEVIKDEVSDHAAVLIEFK